MRFKLNTEADVTRATERLAKLIDKKATVEITQVRYQRSIPQNKFYHVMLSYFGSQTGSTLEEAKTLLKTLQSDLYPYTVKHFGNVSIRTYRSSADLTTAEMTDSIDRFREWARDVADVEIPSPTDENLLLYMQEVIAQNANYL